MKRLKRKLDTSPKEAEKNEREIKDKKFKLDTKKREEAVKHLRKAREAMVGLKLYNRRWGVSISDASILADFIEYDIKQLKKLWPYEPEDLRDDWPHAKPVLREAAKYVQPYTPISIATNTYTTIDLRNTS